MTGSARCFLLLLLSLLVPASWCRGQLAPDQAEHIRKAAPRQARVTPKKPRTVLIWNTPPAFMDKDPHKGYTIPQGECAFRTLARRPAPTGPSCAMTCGPFCPRTSRRLTRSS